VIAALLPAWPSAEEASENQDSARILAALQEEFPGGESEYQLWYTRTLGIMGDPVKSRKLVLAEKASGLANSGDKYGYPRAFTFTPHGDEIKRIHRLAALRSGDGEDAIPTVLDPFSGGGSIPFEAARYGFDTIANELNPVASAILQGTISLPAQLGHDFAREIERWGGKWADRVRNRLSPFFPVVHADERPTYIWAHTVPCPTTGLPTPLAPDFWLSRGPAGRNVAISLEVDKDSGTYNLGLVDGVEAKYWGDRTTYKNGTGTSIWTGETFSGDYIQEMGKADRIEYMLLAVAAARPGIRGRQYRVPTEEDLQAVKAAEKELAVRLPGWEIADLVPSEPIDGISNYDRGHRMYGINTWADFFTPRQLLTNVTALEELRAVAQEATKELGEEKGRALALYLSFALDRMLDYNSRQCSWNVTRTTIRNTFDKHNFAFKWTFAENDGCPSLVAWAVGNAVVNHLNICDLVINEGRLDETDRRAEARIIRGSAAQLPVPDASIDAVVTDPPYYDNVMYAECSDFFYVWLKRSLDGFWPKFTDLVLTDKSSEAVANPALFRDVAPSQGKGRRRTPGVKSASELADAHYEELLKQSFRESHRVLKPSGVLTVMFTHKRIDAWDTLGAALLDAGFSIGSSWPVHTEFEHSTHQAKKNAATSTIFLACRKRANTKPAYWSDIRRKVERVAEEAATRFSTQGMTGVDLTIATYGPVLSVLSDSWPVYTGELDAEGNPEVLRPDAALDLAREKVASLKKRELLGGRDIDFDRVTDWYLLAWNDFAAAEFPFDEARKLSIATHLELDDLARRHRVVKASSGSVTLLTPAQRATVGALDPEASDFATWIDRLHALMLVYDSEGLGAAKAWLDRIGMRDDFVFTEVFRAALHAIPRVKDKSGNFARPEARILDSLRAALFDHIEAPADEEEAAASHEQQALIFDV
jgi:16S rRNA G966 N2-methylase RsmD